MSDKHNKVPRTSSDNKVQISPGSGKFNESIKPKAVSGGRDPMPKTTLPKPKK